MLNNNNNNFLVSLSGSGIILLSLQFETPIYDVTISFGVIAKEKSSFIRSVLRYMMWLRMMWLIELSRRRKIIMFLL